MVKVGKVNWDRMFLELLELSKHHNFLDSLNPYFEAFKTENETWKDLNDEYKVAIKSVKHLENRSSLTEEEFYEWEGAVGWFENAGEEIGFREESLATGLIIAVWKIVNNFAITASKGVKVRSHPTVTGKFDYFKLGPTISGQAWALVMNAASNYVRHADDWSELKKFLYTKGATGNWKVDIPSDTRKRKQTKDNLKILESIGLDVGLLLSNNDMAYSIAKKLDILEKSRLEKKYFQWSNDVLQDVKTVLKL